MSPVIPQKGDKVTIPGKYLLFILTLACIALIIISFSTDALSKPVSVVGGFLVVPLQNGISKAGSYLNDRSEELGEIKALIEENKQLKEQIEKLSMENVEYQQDRYELTNLQNLFELSSQYNAYDTTGARVIAKDSGNWFHSFVINKGSKDGIEPDMNVICDAGLVGRVTDVGQHWAKVLSIIDDSSNVSGKILSTSDNLIVTGDLKLYENGVISFEKLIDSGDRVSEGDKIVTSNISDKYLPGILIGYVTEISKDSNNLTKSGLLSPVVDFEHIENVLVILEKKQTIDDEEDDESVQN